MQQLELLKHIIFNLFSLFQLKGRLKYSTIKYMSEVKRNTKFEKKKIEKVKKLVRNA